VSALGVEVIGHRNRLVEGSEASQDSYLLWIRIFLNRGQENGQDRLIKGLIGYGVQFGALGH